MAEHEQEILQLTGCWRFAASNWSGETIPTIREMPLVVYLNGRELVTILCTPSQLPQLVLGFLYLEGVIGGESDVAYMRVCADDGLAEVRLVETVTVVVPERRVLTTGCGGGVSLAPSLEALRIDEGGRTIEPSQVAQLQRLLQQNARLYAICGGLHASMLTDGEMALAVAEDVGRHNTIDKLAGECLLRGISTAGCCLCTTGRVSSEMLSKAVRMRVPIVISRTSPTQRAVEWGREYGVTIIGYARGNNFTVYSHPDRVKGWPGNAA